MSGMPPGYDIWRTQGPLGDDRPEVPYEIEFTVTLSGVYTTVARDADEARESLQNMSLESLKIYQSEVEEIDVVEVRCMDEPPEPDYDREV